MKRHSPSSERNAGPILEVLARVLPAQGLILEIASGGGYHAVTFGRALPHVTWQPSDADETALASTRAWVDDAALANVRPPVRLDVTAQPWPVPAADAIVCINMLHISPWACAEALLAGAARALPPDGVLVTYGPYRFDGGFTAPSNAAFDQDLRARDASWGVRDVSDLEAAAARVGFLLAEVVAMPANNHTLVWRRAAA